MTELQAPAIRTVDVSEWSESERPSMPYAGTATPQGEPIRVAFATESELIEWAQGIMALTGTYMTSWGEVPVNTVPTLVHYVTPTPAPAADEAPLSGDTVTLWACIDCAQYAHGIDAHERGQDYPQATVDAYSDPARAIGAPGALTAGTLDHDGDCIGEDGNVYPVDDCECERIEFTWNRCDVCLSPLAGERMAFTLWDAPAPAAPWIESAIASGALSPAARDMAPDDVVGQYADANALTEREARAELDAPHRGHRARFSGAWYCDTCDSPYCELA